jgi:AraC-like DNA-binding protein
MALSDSRFWLAVFYNHFSPFMFLIGPFLYFYIRNTLKDQNTLTKKDWIHFIPATIALIGTIPYIIQPFENKLAIADQIIRNLDAFKKIEVNLFYDMGESFVLRCLLTLVYLIYCAHLLFKSYTKQQNEKQYPKKQFLIVYRWFVVLLTCLLLLLSSFIILTLNAIDSSASRTIKEGNVWYVLSGLIYCIMSLSVLLFPEILYGIPRKKTPKYHKKKAKLKTNMMEDPLFDLSLSIQKYLLEKKPFLQADFDISDIALDLNIPQNQVSYCISYIMETKFSKLKSDLRVQHAVELLKKGTNSKLTIEAIGKQSGFKTRSYFYTAFKKEMGITPSEYLQNLNH